MKREEAKGMVIIMAKKRMAMKMIRKVKEIKVKETTLMLAKDRRNRRPKNERKWGAVMLAKAKNRGNRTSKNERKWGEEKVMHAPETTRLG
jgi:hypothetical protein